MTHRHSARLGAVVAHARRLPVLIVATLVAATLLGTAGWSVGDTATEDRWEGAGDGVLVLEPVHPEHTVQRVSVLPSQSHLAITHSWRGEPTLAVGQASHTEFVWAAGFQKEIDACRGSVDLTDAYGVAVIGEHWNCGGSAFPRTNGSIIHLTGVRSGTYRTGPVVAELDKATDGTEDVPRGYDLLYQTCVDNSNAHMTFTALTRIDAQFPQ